LSFNISVSHMLLTTDIDFAFDKKVTFTFRKSIFFKSSILFYLFYILEQKKDCVYLYICYLFTTLKKPGVFCIFIITPLHIFEYATVWYVYENLAFEYSSLDNDGAREDPPLHAKPLCKVNVMRFKSSQDILN